MKKLVMIIGTAMALATVMVTVTGKCKHGRGIV